MSVPEKNVGPSLTELEEQAASIGEVFVRTDGHGRYRCYFRVDVSCFPIGDIYDEQAPADQLKMEFATALQRFLDEMMR